MTPTSGRFTSGILQQKSNLSRVAGRGPEDFGTSGFRSGGELPWRRDSCPLGSPPSSSSKQLVANSLNGQHIRRITRTTIPLTLKISGNHQERLSLMIIDTPHSPVVLGPPWMAKHCPRVDWAKHEILGWDTSCSTRCLRKAHSPAAVPQEEEVLNLEKVPAEYLDLKEVFCKSRATCLPPHRPYDCTIELKPGTAPLQRSTVLSLLTLRESPWRGTSRSPWRQESSGRHRHLQERVSS